MTDFIPFSDRETLSEAEALSLQESGVLVIDRRRSRPLWFDGRFLTARDLLREQNYFLTRQKDVGRATGRGVIEGLHVSLISEAGSSLTKLQITAGHGIAFDGSHVILPEDIIVDLAEIAIADTVNARLGLSEKPAPSLRNLSGLFVLSPRPVEFTANRVASYPTSLDGPRGFHDSDIVEAVAVTLTPFSLYEAPIEGAQTRAYAAKQIFLDEGEIGMPGYALPLAMLSLDQGRVDWLDEPMVRRELAALGRDALGLGLSQDPLRLAHYLHYSDTLEDTVAAYEDASAAPRFAASDHFRTLPAAGQLPSACIDPGGATQSFFPAEMKVDVSLAPDDELPALIEESFAYPPIDLTRAPEEQENVSILILAPVSRARLREQIGALRPIHRAIRPATLFGYGHVKPIERIKTFRLSLRDLEKASRPPEPSVTESAWSQLVRSNRYLWYVRRRTLSRNVALESILVQVVAPEPPDDGPPPEDGMSERMERIERELDPLGAVAKVARREFMRLAPGGRQPFLKFLESEQARRLPLVSIAAILRVSDQQLEAAGKIKAALEPLAAIDNQGAIAVTKGILVTVPRDIPESELRELTPLVVSEHFTAYVDRVSDMGTTERPQSLRMLKNLLEIGNRDAIDRFLDTEASGPTPVRPIVRDFLVNIKQPGTRKALRNAFDKVSPEAHVTVGTVLVTSNAERSRLALAGVTKLIDSGRLTSANAGQQLKGITKEYVAGLARVEPFVLDTVAAGISESQVDGIRIALLVASNTLPLLAEIGRKFSPRSRKLKRFARDLKTMLDTDRMKANVIADRVKRMHAESIP